MKTFFIGTALMLSSVLTFAQKLKPTKNQIGFGLKAGLNLSEFKYEGEEAADYNKNSKRLPGFGITGYANFNLGSNFAIQPGISVQNRGNKLEIVYSNYRYKTNRSIMAIEIPINVLYNISTGHVGAIQLSAGSFVAYNITAKEKIIGQNEDGANINVFDLKLGNKKDDNVARMDYGVNFGLGYRFSSGVTLEARYGLGLANLVPKEAANNYIKKIKSHLIGFTIGYSL